MTLSEIIAARYSTTSTSTSSSSSSVSAAVLDKVSKIMAANNTEAPKAQCRVGSG